MHGVFGKRSAELNLPRVRDQRRHAAEDTGPQRFGALETLHEAVRVLGVESKGVEHCGRITRWNKITEEVGEAPLSREGHDTGAFALTHAADIAQRSGVEPAPMCFRLDCICEDEAWSSIILTLPAFRLATEADG
jgi:hypothetical protein